MSTTCREFMNSARLAIWHAQRGVGPTPTTESNCLKNMESLRALSTASILPDRLANVDELTRWYGSEALELIGDHLDHPGEGQLSGRRKTGALQ